MSWIRNRRMGRCKNSAGAGAGRGAQTGAGTLAGTGARIEAGTVQEQVQEEGYSRCGNGSRTSSRRVTRQHANPVFSRQSATINGLASRGEGVRT